jgi:HlyD family secretion protein
LTSLITSVLGPALPAVRTPGAPDTHDDPRPDLKFGIVVAAVFFVGFLGWAAIAPMDQAAYAQGKVSVAGHRQTVQHKEGGVVTAIYVKEGQVVQKDQVLIQLAGADAQAQERALSSAVIGLKAQRARLIAEQVGGPIDWPAEFALATGPDLAEVQRAEKVQLAQHNAHSSTQSAQGGVYGQRTAQLNEEIKGYEKQIVSTDTQIKLIGDEIDGMRKLNERGFAPITQVRALERNLAQLQAQRAALVAQIASSKEKIGETRLENVTSTKTTQEDIAKQIRDVDFQLNDSMPKLQAAQDQLARTQIRAPASGTVVGLTVFTVGGVIAPGQKVLDVVPARAPMVLEANVSPNDADDLHVGQKTQIKFTGMHERSLPRLSGTLTRISADSFTDDKSGQSYFTAEVTVPLSEIDAIRQERGADFDLKPGMPAQILVPLKKRTALQYLFEPLTDAMWKAGREH